MMQGREALHKDMQMVREVMANYKVLKYEQIYQMIKKEEHRFKKMIINFLVKDNTLFVFDDICSATHSWEHDYDRDLIRAFWVLLDFWDSVIANGRGTYPAKITFQTANESFDVIVANWGSEASLNEYFRTYEDGECRHIVLIEEEEQIDKIKFKDIAAFCIVDDDGKVSYYRKEG